RQTAAAAAKSGLRCTLVLRGREPHESQGNLLLDRLLGAEIVWAEDRPADERLVEVAEELRASGRRPYLVPYGGSTPVGACGYVAAMEELLDQSARAGISFDRIVFPSSSGGTQAGLAVAARALRYKGEVLGISVDLAARALQERLAPLATRTAEQLGLGESFEPDEFVVEDRYAKAGYAVLGDLEREAIRTAAETEGLLLDPVYTGGLPALFAYSEALAV
ncbi:MAG: pyridoxal-phosphate dependent enzyme, partial [Candidatus Bipolaricaulota bacterium]|nr:pyridoxal-phosphate dependent enzyme [Candidatus Bipolaricaulota bacterium]